jgi:hypothetical protein
MIPPGAANYFRVCSKESHGTQCQEQGGKVEFAVEIKYSSHRAANLPMED